MCFNIEPREHNHVYVPYYLVFAVHHYYYFFKNNNCMWLFFHNYNFNHMDTLGFDFLLTIM